MLTEVKVKHSIVLNNKKLEIWGLTCWPKNKLKIIKIK
jgi:hypothetical protein